MGGIGIFFFRDRFFFGILDATQRGNVLYDSPTLSANFIDLAYEEYI